MKRRTILKMLGGALLATGVPFLRPMGRRMVGRDARLSIRDPKTGEWIEIEPLTTRNIMDGVDL